jgi:hypothetical protein
VCGLIWSEPEQASCVKDIAGDEPQESNMNSSKTVRMGRWVAISVLGMALGGCIVAAPPPRHYYVGTVVTSAPPPVRVEEYGPAPGPGYVWLGGYWAWRGERHEWVPGHWERSRPHYRWVPHRWVHERDGWHLSEGHWQRR